MKQAYYQQGFQTQPHPSVSPLTHRPHEHPSGCEQTNAQHRAAPATTSSPTPACNPSRLHKFRSFYLREVKARRRYSPARRRCLPPEGAGRGAGAG